MLLNVTFLLYICSLMSYNQMNIKSTFNKHDFWKSMHPSISVFSTINKLTHCCQPINLCIIKCNLIIYLFVKCMSFSCGLQLFVLWIFGKVCYMFVLFVSKNDINQIINVSLPTTRTKEGTYHEEETDAHHLGRPRHVVMSQSSSLNQLLGDDITDTH